MAWQATIVATGPPTGGNGAGQKTAQKVLSPMLQVTDNLPDNRPRLELETMSCMDCKFPLITVAVD